MNCWCCDVTVGGDVDTGCEIGGGVAEVRCGGDDRLRVYDRNRLLGDVDTFYWIDLLYRLSAVGVHHRSFVELFNTQSSRHILSDVVALLKRCSDKVLNPDYKIEFHG